MGREGGREAKERVEKKASLCCVAWLSTHLMNDVLKSCRFNPSRGTSGIVFAGEACVHQL